MLKQLLTGSSVLAFLIASSVTVEARPKELMLQAQLEETPTTIPAPDASTTPPGTGTSPNPGTTTPSPDGSITPPIPGTPTTPDTGTTPDNGSTIPAPDGTTAPDAGTTPESEDSTTTPEGSTNPSSSGTVACEPIPMASPSGGATRERIQAQQACSQPL
jgi:hypothetical protein